MKNILVFVIAAILVAAAAPSQAARSCAAMKKELTELRREYHQYAVSNAGGTGEAVTFDKLAEILDKIVELKREMVAEKCQIPPRNPDAKGKR